MDRREFIKLSAATGLTYLSFKPLGFADSAFGAADLASPIRDITGNFQLADFNGDEMLRAHEALWNLSRYIAVRGGRPGVSESHDVVVVGGGVSGLASAYHLRNLKPVLLEQYAQFGGNSRGETFDGMTYAMGAAYIGEPDAGGSLEEMLKTIGALKYGRVEPSDEMRVFSRGRGLQAFWNGDADKSSRDLIVKVAADFKKILENSYPAIPWEQGAMARADLDQLDRMGFLEWLKLRYGQLPDSLLEYFQLFCWSSFNGSLNEISAAQALNFLAAETGGVMAFPGGNAFIAKKLYDYLKRELPQRSLRSGAIVLEVKTTASGVEILLESENRLQTIAARHCVIAVPKYVARYIVPELSDRQRQAIAQLKYRAYVVGNVLIDKSIPAPAFDVFNLQGSVPPTPMFGSPSQRVPDVCFANWADKKSNAQSILTIYKPYPFEGARNTLIGPQAYQRVQNEILTQAADILQHFKVDRDRIKGVRLTCWGHAIPVAQSGFLSDRHDEALRMAVGSRIYFANQDNDANPAFETAFRNAELASERILAFAAGSRS